MGKFWYDSVYISTLNHIEVKSLSRVQLYDPMDCSPPGSSVQGIFQAWRLEWVAISRRSSRPRDWTQVSCTVGRCFTVWATREVTSAILNIKHISILVVMSLSSVLNLRYHGLQHTRLPCPSLSPGVCSDSCQLSLWFQLAISSSVTLFTSYSQSFPASGSFLMS